MSNQELVQYVEAPKSVEPAVRSVSRFKELPLWKRGITLATLGLSTIAAACSGTAGNETTTTPPPTSPTTITTEVPTTTIEAPATTTSTTVAKPTTTTEVYSNLPDNITYPSGYVLDPNRVPVPLGKNGENDLLQRVDIIVSGRLIRVYEEVIQDFQGRPESVVFIDIVAGKLPRNDPFIGEIPKYEPFIVKLMLGRLTDQITEDFNYDPRGMRVDTFSTTISDILNELIIQADNYRQIQVQFVTEFTTDYSRNGCNDPDVYNQSPEGCGWMLEGLEHFETNDKISAMLSGKSPIQPLQEGEYVGLVERISLFPPHN